MSERPPRNRTPGLGGAGPVGGVEGVVLLLVVGTDHREPQLRHVLAKLRGRPRTPRRSPSRAPSARRAPRPRRRDRTRRARAARREHIVGRDRRRDRTASRSMPLPSSVSFFRDTPRPRQRLDVFRVLHQLRVREEPGDPLDAVHRRPPGERIVRLRVQAVHGVDDDRHTRDARRDPSVDTGLRVVRVHDRRPQPAEHRDELADRLHVLARARTIGSRAAAECDGCRAARAPRRTGPGAETPTTSKPAAANASSCGPSNSSRLMSVVVTCATSGRRVVTFPPARSERGSSPAGTSLRAPCRRPACARRTACRRSPGSANRGADR